MTVLTDDRFVDPSEDPDERVDRKVVSLRDADLPRPTARCEPDHVCTDGDHPAVRT